MTFISFLFKSFRKVANIVSLQIDKLRTLAVFLGNGVRHGAFRTSGVPYVMVARGGRCTIGNGFAMNNGAKGNPIGCFQPCTLFVDRGASLSIGENVGISQTALIAMADITIEKNVKIGGGTSVYTSDFHSLDAAVRASTDDTRHRVNRPVVIGEGAFIGAHCIILKGVTIGNESIVGAGSVVTKSIPPRQIWAGNPARFIRNL